MIPGLLQGTAHFTVPAHNIDLQCYVTSNSLDAAAVDITVITLELSNHCQLPCQLHCIVLSKYTIPCRFDVCVEDLK